MEHARQLGVNVRGLMTVAPTDVKGAREAFHITSEVADELGLRERSMGMSDDLELACDTISSIYAAYLSDERKGKETEVPLV